MADDTTPTIAELVQRQLEQVAAVANPKNTRDTRAAGPPQPVVDSYIVNPAIGPNPDGLLQQARIAHAVDDAAREQLAAEFEQVNKERLERAAEQLQSTPRPNE